MTSAGHATAGWRVEDCRGLTLVRCALLEEVPSISHAFSTRRADAAGSFDVGGPEPDDPRAAAARRRVAEAAGIAAEPVLLRQVHGTRVVDVGAGREPRDADGAYWTGEAGRSAPAVRTADCVPVLLAHEDGVAAAAVHAGWRGLAGGILPKAIRLLEKRGFPVERWFAAVGPAAGPCCYEVADHVAAAVLRAIPPEIPGSSVVRCPAAGPRPFLALAVAAAAQLRSAGLPAERVAVAPWCTRCEADLFHSHRREGERAGRMLAVVGPRARP